MFDDGAQNVSKITRDYTLRVDGDERTAPVLSVFGGKITTYRNLAEHALEKIASWFPQMRAPWTEQALLPGGDLDGLTLDAFAEQLHQESPALPRELIQTLVTRHGSAARVILTGAKTIADLGEFFGANFYAREVDYFMAHEWASSVDDVLWRRTKAGLVINAEQKQMLTSYMARRGAQAVR